MRSPCTTDAALLLAVLFLAAPAAAQVPLDLSVCRYLPRHRPAPDVEFKPGVDVHGNRVARADLPGSAGAGPVDRFEIPVTLNFARRLGIAAPGAAGLPGNTEIGRLSVQGNRMAFNGQPLGSASEAELYALCRTVN